MVTATIVELFCSFGRIFHTFHFGDLKTFFLGYIYQYMKKHYPQRISHDRFDELSNKCGHTSSVAHPKILPFYMQI